MLSLQMKCLLLSDLKQNQNVSAVQIEHFMDIHTAILKLTTICKMSGSPAVCMKDIALCSLVEAHLLPDYMVQYPRRLSYSSKHLLQTGIYNGHPINS